MDGLSRCREIAARAAADGHAHTAITDHGNCAGHPDFQRACDEYGISPVFGMEGYFIADRTEQPGPGDKEAQKRRRSYAHLILLARDNAGLRNLYSLSSEAYTSGFYAKPCLDWELLEKYGAGLTATTACLGGIISKPLLAGDWDTAAATLRRMRGIFGENFYLEVQPNLIPEQQRLNMLLKEVSASSGIPLAAASDAHYPSPAEESLHRTWMACQTGTGNDDYWQMCVVPETKVLTADLRWIPASAIKRGDSLVGFDEIPGNKDETSVRKNNSRFYRSSTVENIEEITRPCYELEFSDGTVVQCSADHQWLCRGSEVARWVTTERLILRSTQASHVIKPLSTWEENGSRDGGYISAAFDGEGSLSQRAASSSTQKVLNYTRVSFGQRDNLMLAKVESILKESGFDFGKSVSCRGNLDDVYSLYLCRRPEVLRFLGTFRPVRLLESFSPDKLGRMNHESVRLIRKDFIGDRKVIAMQTSSRTYFAEGLASHNCHMHDEAVVRDRLSRALGPDAARQACDNTVRIAEQCTARIGGEIVPPVFSSSYEEDSRALYQRASDALADRHSAGLLADGSLDDYARRLGEEFCLVRDKRLSGCYLMVEDITTWARGEGILVGPGRGSAAGSLMSWLLGITVSDPIDAGLMFSRFLTPGRVSLPDFDLDFPSSQRGKIQDRVISKYGADSVVRVGTHMRYRAKSVLDKLAGVAVSRGELPAEARTDMKAVSALIEEAESHTAGLGLPWDDLMSQLSDGLEPYVQKYPEIFSTAAVLVGRVRGYGKHPAGLVISTGQPLEGTLPMRIASAQDRTVVSQWDFRDMEAQGLLKLDFLTLRTLDSIQEAVRLIGQRTGHRPDPSRWTAEYRDPQVWEEIGTGRTLGMFQVETSLGARFCGDMKPRSIAELAHLVALVRPGPRNSGMDQAYLRRRAGKEEVQYPHPALEDRLRGQQGIMIFQEDILYACTELAGYDGAEADGVRKILGKKLTAKIAAAGEEFARRCEENGRISRKEAEDLWETMATFGKYGFNASHAFSYSVLAFWTGWLKSHYPAETLAAICTTLSEKEKDRIGLYVNEARRLGIDVRPPDVNHHARGFAVEWPRDGEEPRPSVRYGLDAITGVGDSALKALAAGAPFASWDAVRGTVNSGVLRALVTGGALDALVPSRRALAEHLDADRAGDLVRCVHKDETVSGPNGLPCTYEWDKEPVIERLSERTGRRLQPLIKPPPARCTRSCRRYQPPDLSGLDGSLSYAPDVLWRLETGLFGTWLSPDAFTALDARLPGASRLGAELTDMWDDLPAGIYQVPAVFQGLRETVTKAGNTMGWLTLASVTGIIDISCFRPRDPGEPDLLAVAGRIRPGTPVAVLAERSRYRTSSGWRTSGRLRDIRSISAR
jgi:DNA-directed DNA polymerase III PolC